MQENTGLIFTRLFNVFVDVCFLLPIIKSLFSAFDIKIISTEANVYVTNIISSSE